MGPALLDTDTLILRGLKVKSAARQLAAFAERCQQSHPLQMTDDVIIRAADIYADLHRQGHLISNADILVAATALVHHLTLVTENVAHLSRISGLTIESWRIG
jgi:tRNA(fMet)-specific endonuclease VapC